MFIIYRLAPHFTMALKQKLLYFSSLNWVEFSEHLNDDALQCGLGISHYVPISWQIRLGHRGRNPFNLSTC